MSAITFIIISVILFVIFGIITGSLAEKDYDSQWTHLSLTKGENILFYFSIIIVFFCLICIGFGTFAISYMEKLSDEYCTYELYSTENIIALSDNNLANYKTYCRRTYIEEKLYYQYLVKRSDGSMIANKITAETTPIYYDAKPRVEWYNKTVHWFIFADKYTAHTLFIPEGSIIEDFSIDLQ